MEYYRRHPDKESTSDEMTVQIAAGGALASLDGAVSCTSESYFGNERLGQVQSATISDP
jgi:hypothetical protein